MFPGRCLCRAPDNREAVEAPDLKASCCGVHIMQEVKLLAPSGLRLRHLGGGRHRHPKAGLHRHDHLASNGNSWTGLFWETQRVELQSSLVGGKRRHWVSCPSLPVAWTKSRHAQGCCYSCSLSSSTCYAIGEVMGALIEASMLGLQIAVALVEAAAVADMGISGALVARSSIWHAFVVVLMSILSMLLVANSCVTILINLELSIEGRTNHVPMPCLQLWLRLRCCYVCATCIASGLVVIISGQILRSCNSTFV